jgi:hypothetical protein
VAGKARDGAWRHGGYELWLAVELTAWWLVYKAEGGERAAVDGVEEARRRRWLCAFNHTMMRLRRHHLSDRAWAAADANYGVRRHLSQGYALAAASAPQPGHVTSKTNRSPDA